MKKNLFRVCCCAIAVACLFLAPLGTRAQRGVSSASMSMARAGLDLSAESVVVEEYVNYHRHQIEAPKPNETVGFDVRWGAPNADRRHSTAILQIGLATSELPQTKDIPPLNLALVIDKSGSMSGDRIHHVKQALQTLASQLREVDRVSIVAFSDNAEVVFSANGARPKVLKAAIENIHAGGSTNMHAGLMLGYEEVLAHYDKRRTNRVVLLTDGITNTGVTDAEQITRESLAFNDQDIDLSTIGLGSDLNHALLRQLATSGRGLIHFVDDAKDIKKIFIDELQSLMAPQARKVQVEITPDPSLEFTQLFGYQPRVVDEKIIVPLSDLNADATQVLLLEFRLRGKRKKRKVIPLTATLSYEDVTTGRMFRQQATVQITFMKKSPEPIDPLADAEVRKNYTIAQVAQGLKNMAIQCERGDYQRALAEIDGKLAIVHQRYPRQEDRDIQRVVDIARKYSERLTQLATKRDRAPRIRLTSP